MIRETWILGYPTAAVAFRASFSEAEEATVERIGTRLAGSAPALWKVISQSAQEHPDDATILAAAKAVTRPEVRSLLQEVAAGDEVAGQEQRLLSCLQALWG